MTKKLSNIIALIGFIIFPLFVGFLSAFFAGGSFAETYAVLEKPFFSPPAWLFQPIWIILYILMGVAAFLIWQKKEEKNIKPAIIVFLAQLFLNYLWSIIFFGLGNFYLALIDIVLLWIVIIINIVVFYKISKPAAWLLVPYLLWVTFASVLNYMVWRLN
ncbi:MAG: tryptophan-rich sensory protein [Candidatus Pacebacteria bacterium]|nr:tryptophan-rich sensory protein [Candidatus Paceibacterota bacterium]